MYKYFLMCFLVSSLSAGNEPLVVYLETEANILPVYVSPFQNENASFTKEYLNALSDVLFFDIAHGGMAKLKESSAQLEEAARRSFTEEREAFLLFKQKELPYALTVRVSGQKMQAKLFSSNAGSVKSIEGIELTGKLNQDRKAIHQFSDQIHKVIFGMEGIAKTKILYTVRQKKQEKNEWTSDIWEMDYDGANAHAVLEGSGYLVTPQYLPARPGLRPGSFFYVSYKNGTPKIYTGSLSDGKSERLTLLKGNQLMPTMNRQRDTIAFISDAAGNPDLFIMSLGKEEDKPKQVFSAKLGSQGTPAFSPDGKKIAFVSNKDGSPRIYTVDISNSWSKSTDLNPKLVTKFRRGCTAPAWSYDGKKIAYCAPVEGHSQIFVYDLGAEVETQITKGPGNKENPSWASDSLHLVFNNNQGNSSEIFLVDLNLKQPAKITSGGNEKRFPHWEPAF